MANHLMADLDDMVFEGRERNYGAYFLRKRYPRNLSMAVGLVVLLSLMGAFGPLLAKSMGWIKAKEDRESKEVFIDVTKFPPPKPIEEEIEPPVIPPPKHREVKQVEFRIPEPSPEVDPADTATIHKIDELIDTNLGFAEIDGKEEDILFLPIVESEGPEVLINTDPSPEVFTVVDEEPKPINIAEITKLVGYPRLAQDAEIQGRVVLRVLVDKQGKYKKHIVTNAVHPILSEAIEKHINKLMFTPAIQGKRPIKFWVNIPFTFNLVK